MEVLCEVAAFLAERHPTRFLVSRCLYDKSDEATWGDSIGGREAGRVRKVENLMTGSVFDFEELARTEGPDWEPMRVAGRKWFLKVFLGRLINLQSSALPR